MLDVKNIGEMTHDLKLDGEDGSDFLYADESERVNFGVIDESTRAWCTVPGHLEAGMVMDIIATEPAARPDSGAN